MSNKIVIISIKNNRLNKVFYIIYKMIKLCIFDMDGLLIDSERYMWTVSMDIATKEQGYVMTDEFHSMFMGKSRENTIKMCKEHFGPGFDAERMFERSDELNQDIIKNNKVPLMNGVLPLLQYLKENNIKMCVGTSSVRKVVEQILTNLKIIDYFDVLVCGDEVINGKPNPEIYIKCLERFNVKKEEAVILEDGDSGGQAAIAAGVRLVLVPDLAYVGDEVKSKAYKVLDNIADMIEIVKEENERATCI